MDMGVTLSGIGARVSRKRKSGGTKERHRSIGSRPAIAGRNRILIKSTKGLGEKAQWLFVLVRLIAETGPLTLLPFCREFPWHNLTPFPLPLKNDYFYG